MSINDWAEIYLNKPSRLLIVDDNVGIVRLIKDALKNYDCDFAVASCASSALDCLQSEKFDLIFVDIAMPDRSGVELLKEIKQAAPETPVIVMTGYFNGELLEKTADLGIVSFMRKPFDFNQDFIKNIFRTFKINVSESELAPTTP
jgi:DNA-binding NtrC family response regulator